MYAGETNTVTFRCKESILDQMIDIFESDMPVILENDGNVIINVKTTDTGALFLAQQYMDAITIVKPIELRNKFIEQLREVEKRYE